MNFSEWEKIAKYDINSVANFILTGKRAEDFLVDTWLYSLIGNKDDTLSILDFGCGIGRNIFGMELYSKNWNVTGYDCETMLSRVEEYKKIKYNEIVFSKNSFEYQWDILRKKVFNCIFCSLVLQHVPEQDIKSYVSDFKLMTSRIIVSGRRFNDEKKRSTWTILQECGIIPQKFFKNGLESNFNAEGDPDEHNTAIYVII